MKTLNQKELFLVWGGNDEGQDEVASALSHSPEGDDVIVEPSFLQLAGAYLSKLSFGCCS
ncbi:MAG: hypothetical protein AB7V32_10445 [Candidatus Berkiella sp.]